MVILVALGVAVGLALGFAFFGGLWWTTRRLSETRRPALLVSASLLLRLVVATATLIVLARADPALLVSALVGMLAARFVLLRRVERDGTGPGVGTDVLGGR